MELRALSIAPVLSLFIQAGLPDSLDWPLWNQAIKLDLQAGPKALESLIPNLYSTYATTIHGPWACHALEACYNIQTGQYVKAAKLLEHCHALIPTQDNLASQCVVILQACWYLELKMLTQAENTLDTISAFLPPLTHAQHILQIQISLARNLPDSALALASQNLLTATNKDPWLNIHCHIIHSACLANSGRIAEATIQIEVARKNSAKAHSQPFLALCNAQLSTYLTDHKASLRIVKQSLQAAESSGLTQLTAWCHQHAAHRYEQGTSPTSARKALEHFRAHQNLVSSIFTDQLHDQIADLRHASLKTESSAYQHIVHQLSTISNLGRQLTSYRNQHNILNFIRQHITDLVPCDAFGLALYNEAENQLDYAFFVEGGQAMPGVHIAPDNKRSLGARCFQTGQEIYSTDIDKDWSRFIEGTPPHPGNECKSLIFVPLECRNIRLGILTVQHRKPQTYSLMDLDTVKAIAAYLAIAIDNANLVESLTWQASYDQLTGLRNRRSILEKATDNFLRHRRYNNQLALLMIDIDHFKDINDRYGHQTGDRVLSEIARRIEFHMRDCDFLGRYGGEEFLAILPETDAPGALILAERIRSACISLPIDCGNDQWNTVSVSIGLHQASKTDTDLDDAINHADEALYWCKHHGRNQVCQWHSTISPIGTFQSPSTSTTKP